MVAASFSADALIDYFKIMNRNYVHDSIMAANLGYFAKLCVTYASQLDAFGDKILSEHLLKQKFEYLAEDLGDAIADAEDDTFKDAAKTALGKLTDTIKAARVEAKHNNN
jgi:hypothetical protein